MKLIGKLKKKVENAGTKEEAREAIKNAGMLLDDEELLQVSGGGTDPREKMDPKLTFCTDGLMHDWVRKEVTDPYGKKRIVFECRKCHETTDQRFRIGNGRP